MSRYSNCHIALLALAGGLLLAGLWPARAARAAAPTTPGLPGTTDPITPTIPAAWTIPLAGALAHTGQGAPAAAVPIGAGNARQLVKVAQWGTGTLLAVAFAPDGRHFVAGSAFRLAVYDRDAPDQPPAWLNLDPPASYDRLTFSADGQYLRLEGLGGIQVRRLATSQIVPADSGRAWQTAGAPVAADGSVDSPDGRLRLTSTLDMAEDSMIERSRRQLFDRGTGRLRAELADPTMYVRFSDRSTPEGCDLYSFSYCGNVYDPAALAPYQAAFAPDSHSLAVLYRAPEIWNSSAFSLLKLYAAADGALRQVWGTFDQPVQTFAYAPDSRQLLVGYADGSVTLWDLDTPAELFGARHFSGPVYDLAFSADSRLLLLKTPGELEVRRAADGALWQRLAARTFAASPVEDLVALGQPDGWLQLLDLATGRLRYSQPAHARAIDALAFSADGQLLASAGQDCRVVLSSARSGEFKHLFQANTTDAYGEGFTRSRIFIDALTFVPGTQQLMGYGSWARVVSWNVNSGATRYFIEPAPLEYYQGMVTLNPHFPELFNLDEGRQRFMVDSAQYDLSSGASLGAYRPPATLEPGCEPFGPVSRDGEVQFTRGYDAHAGQVCLLAAGGQHLLGTLAVVPTGDSAPALGWPYLSPDGRQLAVTVSGGPVVVFQVSGGSSARP